MLGNGVLATPEVDWRSALDFYNNAVVPLERLTSDDDAKRLSGS